ncbi:MAG: hypothetical protein M1819_000692 [Sarea resinae]|nr:MAG: hypothetical protein M1819_000692 [Sarea resinae]
MVRSPQLMVDCIMFFIYFLLLGYGFAAAYPSASSDSQTSVQASETLTSYRAIFTAPASEDDGQALVSNIDDLQAVDAQTVCPGYTASDLRITPTSLTATLSLAGDPCNIYGTDIDRLSLTVEYQSADRLHVEIIPAVIDASNSSWYMIPDHLVHKPTVDPDANATASDSDLAFGWSNDPTFSFTVTRKSTRDVLFTTAGSKIVFENQFLEFASPLPANYNLYGLGESIHGFRLGNNFTKTMYAADTPDTIDT